MNLFSDLLSHHKSALEQKRALEEERKYRITLQQQRTETEHTRPDHVLLFMITPFSSEYAGLEKAVRLVFERPPYFFEVRLARDYTHDSGLLGNVRQHMMRAHGFVAEVSDLNPNVMFELGAAMLSQDGRPVFSLRSKTARDPLPSDFKEKLYIPYSSIQQGPESLADEIRRAFERDGRMSHEAIRSLLTYRKKCFLSRTFLETLERTRLQPDEILGLLKSYTTLEEVLDTTPVDLMHSTGMEEYVGSALHAELKRQKERSQLIEGTNRA